MVKLSFFGGAQEVTGANYLFETDKVKLLIDCGMIQCPRFCAGRNRNDFQYDVRSVDALFVTHAHIDHTGRIPFLVKKGFRGTIYSTPPTRDFSELMLDDSLGVLEKEAAREGEGDAFYSIGDVEQAMSLWEGAPYGKPITVGDVTVTLHNAGHILGSTMFEIVADGKRFLFTGDVGNTPMPLLDPPEFVKEVEYLIIESAYGNRAHEDTGERKMKLERAIEDVVKRGGTLIIPSFALERTQELLYEFNDLVEYGRIPRVPIYIDSPLAIRATAVYKKYQQYFNKSAKDLIRGGDDLFQFPGLRLTLKTEESKSINTVSGPKVILAGAGMMQGGRILHHARRYLPGKENMILFVGYQAAGSIGRRIIDGETRVNIFGEPVHVNAEVRSIRGYSAHADMNQLFDFVQQGAESLKKVFVVQGEPAASLFLSQRVRDYLGLHAHAPHIGDTFSF